MKRTSAYRSIVAAIVVVATITAQPTLAQQADTTAGRFDTGKMWTFEYPPAAYFTETYGVEANEAWFTRARMAALRIPGCSASFVSPNGLLATNHHCIRGTIPRVTQPGESLLDNGFYATSVDEERRIPRYYADQLIAIEDVSDEIFAATDAASPAERDRARETAFAGVERRLLEQHGTTGDSTWVQMIALYHGGRYSAYVFRRYTDIRLVVAAELQMGFFGGDPDNFTYPRYALDFAFLRVYGADGQPYRSENYFGWGGETGVQEGDVVFVIGNPGPTNRLNTVAQLEYQRDVELPATLRTFRSRLRAMGEFRDAYPAEAERISIRNRMFSLSNSLKATIGRLDALNTPMIMARRRDAERRMDEAILGDSALRERYGQTFARTAAVQQEKRPLGASYGAFRLMGSATYASQTIRRALAATAFLDAQTRGAPADTIAALRERLVRMNDLPRDLERRFLIERLADFRRYFGPDHDITRAALGGRLPAEAADSMLEYSAFATSERTRLSVADGGFDPEDPALELGRVLRPYFEAYRRERGRLRAQERELAADLGRARFVVYGQDIAPDATFSPRITDGVVKGYEYNGTLAPPYTTFYGLYDRAYSHRHASDWDLPARWQTPPPGLDLATPLNFVSTADTYGGNSGSPAVTKELALVGLNFDRNIEGLSRDYIYLPERGRNIMVDVRAVHAALDNVYDADRIVAELTTGRLFRTEAEADTAR